MAMAAEYPVSSTEQIPEGITNVVRAANQAGRAVVKVIEDQTGESVLMYDAMRIVRCLGAALERNGIEGGPPGNIRLILERPFNPASEKPNVGSWLPMENAPKNGTWILILFDSASVDVVRLCWWNDGSVEQNNGEADPESVGWWSYKHSVTQEMIDHMTPLGWMPMPPRPAA